MMIGMVLVTHGRLATEFIAALEHVVGPQQRIAAVCIGADDDMEQRRRDILDSVAKVEEGDGVVLLTDMFGGTPSNLAISVLDRANVEVIAGVNLPMLIKLASVRSTSKLPVAVTIDGISAALVGVQAPGNSVAGVLQINATIPTGVKAGNSVPVVVAVGTALSQAKVTMAVK